MERGTMATNDEIAVRCIRCGHTWLVDVRMLGQPEEILFRSGAVRIKVSSYRLVCPLDGTVNMLDVETEEPSHGR